MRYKNEELLRWLTHQSVELMGSEVGQEKDEAFVAYTLYALSQYPFPDLFEHVYEKIDINSLVKAENICHTLHALMY
jgi:hypothetical protein